ncbi:hypothetical protein [Streptomyces incanus]|uniref:Uncharacterized protein n=1 Tax=Streptomyces incanus TaxID=887453 RepID=A0ABW0XWY5_9ACTN
MRWDDPVTLGEVDQEIVTAPGEPTVGAAPFRTMFPPPLRTARTPRVFADMSARRTARFSAAGEDRPYATPAADGVGGPP